MVPVPGVGRPRESRNSRNLSSSVKFINPNSAIGMDPLGRLEFKIGPGEPFTQSSAGLVLVIDPAGEDFLTKSATGIDIDENVLYSFVSYYGS